MQESGSASPQGQGPGDATTAAQSQVSGETPGDVGAAEENTIASSSPPAAKNRVPSKRPLRRTSDPVIRWLTIGIFFVIIFWLVSILSAMMFGLLSPAQSPRTQTERDILALTATAQSGKATTRTYAQYVEVLINAGQLSKAQQALDEAFKTAKVDRSYLYAQQAKLALMRKDYAGAVATADKAMAEAQKELTAFMDENVKNNRRREAGAKVPASFADSALVKAEALVASKDNANAVKAFDVYLKQSPTDSDILVQRAQIKLLVGDKKGAEADYRAALKYIPDYQPALDGLKQIGVTR